MDRYHLTGTPQGLRKKITEYNVGQSFRRSARVSQESVSNAPEVAPKRWRQALAWVGKEVATHLMRIGLGLAITGAALLTWLTGAGRWLIGAWSWIVGRPLVIVSVVLGLAVAVLAEWLRRTSKALELARRDAQQAPAVALAAPKPPPFDPITVDDEQLHLRWIIRQPPQQWLSLTEQRNVHRTGDILDGPFHAAPNCNERLHSNWDSHELTLDALCPGCNVRIFDKREYSDPLPILWDVRWKALQELQRMSRNGAAIEGPKLTLQRPLYWNTMSPPRGGRGARQ